MDPWGTPVFILRSEDLISPNFDVWLFVCGQNSRYKLVLLDDFLYKLLCAG